MAIRWLFIFGSVLISLGACSVLPAGDSRDAYVQEVLKWREQRLAELRKPDGWPTLVGLYWLEAGENTVGSDRENDIRFPDATPGFLGTFHLHGDSVTYSLAPGNHITLEGEPVLKGNFRTDLEDNTTYLYWKSFQWHIIHRGEKYGVRLRDTLHPARMHLTSIPAYPIDAKWNKRAVFIKTDSAATVSMKNQVGMTLEYAVEGYLVFRHRGRQYRLAALDGGPEDLFVLISDRTTGVETYGGGRYLYVPRPKGPDHVTFIDFNKAYNPPCVFTDFATCLLPPPENALPFLLKAGEKDAGHH